MSVKTTLCDGQRTIQVEVADENGGLAIYPAGYGLFACANGTAGPILLELHEGRLRLIVWDDIKLEDPSHIIDLELAREDQRRDTRNRAVPVLLTV